MRRTQNTNRFVNYLAVIERIKDHLGIDFQPSIVEEHVYDCLREIGGVAIETYYTCIPIKDYKIEADELPCNLYNLISVTDNSSAIFAEAKERNSTFEYNKNYVDVPYGRFLDYVFDEKGLRFNVTGIDACLEYEGIKTDEEGRILFEEDKLKAVSAYVVHQWDYAKFRAGTLNPNIYVESKAIMQKEMSACKRSFFNRNYMDKAIKKMYSFNRNRYFY
jgi:hypothetical protein